MMLGDVYCEMNKLDDALQRFEQSLEIREQKQLFGPTTVLGKHLY